MAGRRPRRDGLERTKLTTPRSGGDLGMDKSREERSSPEELRSSFLFFLKKFRLSGFPFAVCFLVFSEKMSRVARGAGAGQLQRHRERLYMQHIGLGCVDIHRL
jgi:hypothetical protein